LTSQSDSKKGPTGDSRANRAKAAALKYNPGDDIAPVIIASGYGTTAEKIIDIAEQNGIPVYRDDSTASLLCMLDVGRNIPVELYEVVAAIYAQILKASKDILDTGSNENLHKQGYSAE
jgi:flagellar biosynthesis protein